MATRLIWIPGPSRTGRTAADRAEAVVKDRLTKEISYWDHRAQRLKLQETAGWPDARLNSPEASIRTDQLQERLSDRLEELRSQRQTTVGPSVVAGGMVVVPKGLLNEIAGLKEHQSATAADTQAIAARARAIVMAVERKLGFDPTDREFERLGYDIESRVPETGRLRLIEVKGRVEGAPSISVTRNEILVSLNRPDDYILAIVVFAEKGGHQVRYLRQPFRREPDFEVTKVDYSLAGLLQRAGEPS